MGAGSLGPSALFRLARAITTWGNPWIEVAKPLGKKNPSTKGGCAGTKKFSKRELLLLAGLIIPKRLIGYY